MSFFSRLEARYKTVPRDGRIETLTFLEASRVSIIPMLDNLGQGFLGKNAFALVIWGVNDLIGKLRNRYNERPDVFHTLTAIVDQEIAKGTTNDRNSATDALLWLTRALNLICVLIQNLLDVRNEDDDIKPCILGAYDIALKPHHNWFERKLVQAGFSAISAPSYSDLKRIIQGDEENWEVCMSQVKDYQTLLRDHITAIREIYSVRSLDPQP